MTLFECSTLFCLKFLVWGVQRRYSALFALLFAMLITSFFGESPQERSSFLPTVLPPESPQQSLILNMGITQCFNAEFGIPHPGPYHRHDIIVSRKRHVWKERKGRRLKNMRMKK